MNREKIMDEQWIVCGKTYRILRLLGHGKGGYSYLADSDGQRVVVKQILFSNMKLKMVILNIVF